MPEGSKQRLFLALWPGEDVRAELHRLSQSVRPTQGRAVEPADLHITLVFLGGVEQPQLECVQRVVGEISPPPPFELVLDSLGHWRHSGILWCAPSSVPSELTMLVDLLQHALKRCGSQPEKRRYTPHVTLYRRSGVVAGSRLFPTFRWPVTDFVLVRSMSGAGPGRYQIIKKWPLGS